MFPKISIIKPLFDEDLSKDGLTASEYWLATSIETIKSIARACTHGFDASVAGMEDSNLATINLGREGGVGW